MNRMATISHQFRCLLVFGADVSLLRRVKSFGSPFAELTLGDDEGLGAIRVRIG